MRKRKGPANTGAWGTGSNATRQVGDGTAVTKSSPVRVGGSAAWSNIAAGGDDFFDVYWSLGVKANGTLWAWGSCQDGVLGNGTSSGTLSTPKQIGTLTTWQKVFTGNANSAAIRATDGALFGWGSGMYGQLGNGADGTGNFKSSPIQIGSLTSWQDIGLGDSYTVAIRAGRLYAWGLSQYGESGNAINASSTPVQVGSLTTWVGVSAGTSHSLFILGGTTSGSLWAAGRNDKGQSGRTGTSIISSPIQIGTYSDWTQVSARKSNSAAIRAPGTLWTWGENTSGQLGLGDITNHSSPTQVGTGTDWAEVSMGFDFCLARKTDNSLWVWGGNTYGQLGRGSLTPTSSPIQIGSDTDWADVSAGWRHSLFIRS